ncbi:hypothetical protein CLU79DRAFT_348238 [Phycomyces nitens]|nr:hypothetical protein CLU79DRAFT_348238 [Phycomyces nitens]
MDFWFSIKREKKDNQFDVSPIIYLEDGGKGISTRKRRPHYRRPPAKLYSEESQPQKTPSLQPTPKKSLLSLSGIHTRPASTGSGGSSLLQLRAKMANATIKPSNEKKEDLVEKSESKPTSLQALAQKSANQRGKSALQHLASRQTQTSNAKTPVGQTSLGSLSQKSSAPKGLTSLAHLASRSQQSEEPRNTQAQQERPIQKLASSSLSGLAKRTTTTNISPTPKPVAPLPKPDSVKQNTEANTQPSEPLKYHIPPPQQNPLCAPPSSTAEFLFKDINSKGTDSRVDQLVCSLPSTLGRAFYEAMESSANTIQMFPFDKPSPDDIVMNAQTNRSGGKIRKA